MASYRFPVPLTVLLLACRTGPSGPLTRGIRVGTAIAFEVSADSSPLEFDCAHGLVRKYL